MIICKHLFVNNKLFKIISGLFIYQSGLGGGRMMVLNYFLIRSDQLELAGQTAIDSFDRFLIRDLAPRNTKIGFSE